MKLPQTPDEALQAARERFRDALQAAEVHPDCHLGLIAAAEAVAKARAVAETSRTDSGRAKPSGST